MRKEILFLSLEDVIKAGGTEIDRAVEDMTNGFTLLYEGKIVNPMKVTLRQNSPTAEKSVGLVNCMPAYIQSLGGNEDIFSCKILGAMPVNVEHDLPRATGLIILFDPDTKTPLAVIDAQVISAMRTGAVSSIAADKFLPKDIDSIALVGAGVNMRTQLLGILKARPSIKHAGVYSRGQSKIDFAKEMSEKTGIKVEPFSNCEELVRGRKMVVTCLPNIDKPVVMNDWVGQKGMTCFNIGCYEMETSILSRMDRVVADMWLQGKHRGVQTHARAVQQNIIPENKIEDLAPIVAGIKPGRTSDDENIFFTPTGLGFEDAIVAHRVYKTAIERSIGQKFSLWNSSKWI